ncbi:head-tail adaptor protein [Yersinia kristensenii]|nr:head-tail adaptor protein [Yersinia kristensenii]
MKPLTSGELDQRILFRKIETARGQAGGVKPSKIIDVGFAWAKVESISNRKIRTSEEGAVVETCLFTLRPRKDVQIDWQIVLFGAIYTVRAVDRTTQRDRLIITGEADKRHDRVPA